MGAQKFEIVSEKILEQIRAVVEADAPPGWEQLRVECKVHDYYIDVDVCSRMAKPQEAKRYNPKADAVKAAGYAARAEGEAEALAAELSSVEAGIRRLESDPAGRAHAANDSALNTAVETRKRVLEEARHARAMSDAAADAAQRAVENSVIEQKYDRECQRVRQCCKETEMSLDRILGEFSESGWVSGVDGWESFPCDDFELSVLCETLIRPSARLEQRGRNGFTISWSRDKKVAVAFTD